MCSRLLDVVMETVERSPEAAVMSGRESDREGSVLHKPLATPEKLHRMPFGNTPTSPGCPDAPYSVITPASYKVPYKNVFSWRL